MALKDLLSNSTGYDAAEAFMERHVEVARIFSEPKYEQFLRYLREDEQVRAVGEYVKANPDASMREARFAARLALRLTASGT